MTREGDAGHCHQQTSEEGTRCNTRKQAKLETEGVRESGWDHRRASRQLRPSISQPPRIYGLSKIHETRAPHKPIVCALEPLAISSLNTLPSHISSCRQDRFTFEELQARWYKGWWTWGWWDEMLVSFDVLSLFTHVPIDKSVKSFVTNRTGCYLTRRLSLSTVLQRYALGLLTVCQVWGRRVLRGKGSCRWGALHECSTV